MSKGQTDVEHNIFGDLSKSVSENVDLVQQTTNAFELNVFSKSQNTQHTINNSTVVSNASYFSLNEEELHSFLELRPSIIKLSIRNELGREFELTLVKYDIFSVGHETGYCDSTGYHSEEIEEGLFYRGVIESEEKSWATLSVSEFGIQGLLALSDGNWILGQLKNHDDYVFYNDKDLSESSAFLCGVDGADSQVSLGSRIVHEKSLCPIDVFWVPDYDFFVLAGYNVSQALYNMFAIFNSMSALYQQEGISVLMGEAFIFTSPDGYSEVNSSDAFFDFGIDIHATASFDEDLAMLIALNTNGNSLSYGILDALCSNFTPYQYVEAGRYAYSRIDNYSYALPTYSWTVSVVTHEMGHNLGSRHTHWCGWPGGAIDDCAPVEPGPSGGSCPPGPFPANGGTIMSYCHNVLGSINFYNGFGFYPNQAIISNLNDASWCICNVGLTEFALDDMFTIYPNPNTGTLHVDVSSLNFVGENIELSVVTTLGEVLIDWKETNYLNTSQLMPGSYLLRIKLENSIVTKPFSKL
ncbi:MAG: M12 family metallo-peptidase [Crocinitomicaceae bacterium]